MNASGADRTKFFPAITVTGRGAQIQLRLTDERAGRCLEHAAVLMDQWEGERVRVSFWYKGSVLRPRRDERGRRYFRRVAEDVHVVWEFGYPDNRSAAGERLYPSPHEQALMSAMRPGSERYYATANSRRLGRTTPQEEREFNPHHVPDFLRGD